MALVAFVCNFISFFQWRIQHKSFRIVWRMIGLKISINWLVFIHDFRNKRLCRSVIWCIELKRVSQICTRLLSKIHACPGEQIRLGPLSEVGPPEGLHWCQETQGKISMSPVCRIGFGLCPSFTCILFKVFTLDKIFYDIQNLDIHEKCLMWKYLVSLF